MINFLKFESIKERDDFAIKTLLLLLTLWLLCWLFPKYIVSNNNSDIEIEQVKTSSNNQMDDKITYPLK
jgi:hypothetical protein